MDQTIQLTERLLLDNESAVAKLACTRANYPAAHKAAQLTAAQESSLSTLWNGADAGL